MYYTHRSSIDERQLLCDQVGTSNVSKWPYAPARSAGQMGPSRLVRQTHDKCQSDVKAQNVLVVEMTDLSSNSLPPNGDGLIGHHLRSDSQPIFLSRINRHPEVWRIAELRSHPADDHRRMSARECVRLYNYCRARLTVVAACRNCHHVAALHWASNSDTDSGDESSDVARGRLGQIGSCGLRKLAVSRVHEAVGHPGFSNIGARAVVDDFLQDLIGGGAGVEA